MNKTEYMQFMCNPDNEFKCDSCPENCGHDGNGFDYRYPCNQQNCWVTMHIRRNAECQN